MEEVSSFIDFIQYEKRFSIHTVQSYRNDLEQFFYFIDTTYQTSAPDQITRQMVRSWVISLIQDGMAPASVRRKCSSLQSFYKFLQKKHKYTTNPVKGIILPKSGTKVPAFLRMKEAEELLDQSHLYSENPFRNALDSCILAMLYLCGMRREEVLHLRVNNVYLASREIHVIGKGKKQRIVPMVDELQHLIREYLSLRSGVTTEKDADYFFINEKGVKLYPNYIYRLAKTSINRIATSEKSSPHVLRHTFASHLSQNGADLNAIKSLLGHSSLSSTQIYTHHSLDGLKKIYQNAHPKANDNH